MFRDRFLNNFNFFQTFPVSRIIWDIYTFDFATHVHAHMFFFVPIVRNCPCTRMVHAFMIRVCDIFFAYS